MVAVMNANPRADSATRSPLDIGKIMKDARHQATGLVRFKAFHLIRLMARFQAYLEAISACFWRQAIAQQAARLKVNCAVPREKLWLMNLILYQASLILWRLWLAEMMEI